ncbi:MAG TPA: glycosyltransferase [Pseudonocardiaceae bacterium]|nr:glycosyltransferase [Pseudonocardiaceae bacterium]
MGVVIPARDESRTIVACVQAVLAAFTRLPAGVQPALCVVADRCTDDTAELVERLGSPPVRVLRTNAPLTIGEIRAAGVHVVAALLRTHRPWHTWLLSTDADTLVPPEWALRHVLLAESGAAAVAGEVRLAGGPGMSAGVARRYSATPAGVRNGKGHGSVYGANLGVRADAYADVGGFGAVASGEDHDLWHRLCTAGYRCEYADGLTVLTSARRQGRAPGGLSVLLAALDHEP